MDTDKGEAASTEPSEAAILCYNVLCMYTIYAMHVCYVYYVAKSVPMLDGVLLHDSYEPKPVPMLNGVPLNDISLSPCWRVFPCRTLWN